MDDSRESKRNIVLGENPFLFTWSVRLPGNIGNLHHAKGRARVERYKAAAAHAAAEHAQRFAVQEANGEGLDGADFFGRTKKRQVQVQSRGHPKR